MCLLRLRHQYRQGFLLHLMIGLNQEKYRHIPHFSTSVVLQQPVLREPQPQGEPEEEFDEATFKSSLDLTPE